MSRRKRSYIPKVKGCRECSQRRIDCDGISPTCLKCKQKGIQCSGQGIRFKVVTSAKASYRHIPQVSSIDEVHSGNGVNDGLCDVRNHSVQSRASLEKTHDAHIDFNRTSLDGLEYPGEAAFSFDRVPQVCQMDKANGLSRVGLNTMDSRNQHLLLYFSEKIAPILVLIDDQYNGWRHLVLPLAHTNELIMDAVISVSTFAIPDDSSIPGVHQPNLAYQTVIRKLRSRQNLLARDDLEKQCVLLALLLLLAGTIVNGSCDFRAILRLIEAYPSAINDENIFIRGELGVFLLTQIEKFRGFASPFLSQHRAIEILSQTTPVRPPTSKGWTEFLTFCDLYPSLSSSMSIIYQINQQACDIYLSRSSVGSGNPDAFTTQVDDFVFTLKRLPVDCPGEYSLVWPVFLVALESTTTHQRHVLMDFLTRQYRQYGFTYVTQATEYLALEWEGSKDNDWTKRLTKLEVFVV